MSGDPGAAVSRPRVRKLFRFGRAFEADGGYVRAVDGVDFQSRGETLGLVGGERLRQDHTARCILRAIERRAARSSCASRGLGGRARPARPLSCGRCVAIWQMIFQDPFTSLNRDDLLDLVGEPLLATA